MRLGTTIQVPIPLAVAASMSPPNLHDYALRRQGRGSAAAAGEAGHMHWVSSAGADLPPVPIQAPSESQASSFSPKLPPGGGVGSGPRQPMMWPGPVFGTGLPDAVGS